MSHVGTTVPGMKRMTTIMTISALTACLLGAASSARAAPATAAEWGGNVLVSWSVPGGTAAGVTSLTFPLTVAPETARLSGTYFAQQFGFAHATKVGYTGLQPRPDANGHARIRGVFSSFIPGTVTAHPNCHDGADGGPGVSCGVEFDAVYGHTYDMVVTADGLDTWSGHAVDTVTGAAEHIGTWTLPSGSGSLTTHGQGFAEYYAGSSCDDQLFYDVAYGAPRGGELTGTTAYEREYGGCVGSGRTTVTDTGQGGVHLTRGTVGRPAAHLYSATRGRDGITVRGWAQPGSRLKTTNDPGQGWFDPESGLVLAAADGSFTLVSDRTIDGQAAVTSFDPTSGAALTESNHIDVAP